MMNSFDESELMKWKRSGGYVFPEKQIAPDPVMAVAVTND